MHTDAWGNNIERYISMTYGHLCVTAGKMMKLELC